MTDHSRSSPSLFATRRHPAMLTASSLMALAAANVHAVENGVPITPPGIFDFGSGILPPPSDVGAVGVRFAFLRASTLKDGSGNTSAVKPKMKINAVVLAGLKMTDQEFLGGKYGFGVVVPTVDGSMDLTIPTPAGSIQQSGKNRAVGDVQIAPVIIQWKPQPNFFINASVVSFIDRKLFFSIYFLYNILCY